MSYRDILILRLMEEESVCKEMYKCPAGKNTIGCGHNCDANSLPPDMQRFLDRNGYTTDAMIDSLLEKDISCTEAEARKVFTGFDTFTVNRQAAIVDLNFNMGITTFSNYLHTIEAVRQGDWNTATKQLQKSKWYTQVGARGPRVVSLISTG